MARARTKASELARLLNAAAQPVYVIDGEHTIVFCNRACLEWIGRDADEMEGLRATYHTPVEETGPETAAAGLCPPPPALSEGQAAGTLEVPLADGRISRRRARFVAIGGFSRATGGLIVLVDAEELSETAEEHGASESIRLHERLAQFRRSMKNRYKVDRLLGESPVVRRVRAQIELAAASRASVLVVGPPGSGRQHVAAAIHYGGQRAGSMIPLACGVLGAELVQSTIGALASRKWSDEHAAPTTLVLNGADGLPREVQKEAAALFDKSFPLRLIATAVEPLDELVRRGEFRGDLAAVLSTIAIELPPLAERREDVPLLAQMFVEEANAQSASGKQLAGFSPEALDRLDAYAWPGNVDELAQMVAEAHERAEGPEITPVDLPERIRLAAAAATHPHRAEETIALDEFLGRIERELIERALGRAKGNKTKAARLLGLTRPRLYRRLVQLGMEEER
jgi:DNA-binding NtrC family response regulator